MRVAAQLGETAIVTSFPLRMPDHVLAQAREAAREDNTSVNQLLTSFIAQGLGQRQGLRMMHERAARADVDAVLAMLDQAPDVPPDEGDERADDGGIGKPERSNAAR